MQIDKFIRGAVERYVREVVRYLPKREKKAARIRLENNIYSMLSLNAGDRPVSSQDLEDVFKELGTPAQTAAAYFILKERRSTFWSLRDLGSITFKRIMLVLKGLMLLSAVFMVSGILGMAVNSMNHVSMFFAGCMLALTVQVVRSFAVTGYDRRNGAAVISDKPEAVWRSMIDTPEETREIYAGRNTGNIDLTFCSIKHTIMKGFGL